MLQKKAYYSRGCHSSHIYFRVWVLYECYALNKSIFYFAFVPLLLFISGSELSTSVLCPKWKSIGFRWSLWYVKWKGKWMTKTYHRRNHRSPSMNFHECFYTNWSYRRFTFHLKYLDLCFWCLLFYRETIVKCMCFNLLLPCFATLYHSAQDQNFENCSSFSIIMVLIFAVFLPFIRTLEIW